ncbi:MAG: hypothetical protein V9G12_19410 [Microthrixaceae bacterium]
MRRFSIFAMAAATTIAPVASCSQCDLDCSASGVSVQLDDVGPVKARVCIDDDCLTTPITPDRSAVAREDVEWSEGRDVVVTVELLGPSDQVLGTITEERRMFDPEQECRCAVFGYRWRDGTLSPF